MPGRGPLHERQLITSHSGNRPYGAKLTFQINHIASIGNLEDVSVLLQSGAIARIRPARSASWEGGRKFQITLDGFMTAASAETEGLRMTQSVLLLATSLNFGVRLIYHGLLPTTTYERYRPRGPSAYGEGTSGYSAQVVLEELVAAYQGALLDPTITLSMELYCSAPLEESKRARFITVVSALEPLAKQLDLGADVNAFVETALGNLSSTNIEPMLRASIKGRIEHLRHESVRQALLRLAGTWFPNRADLRRKIDRAYGLRSELLHNGALSDSDCDLGVETETIASILRSIYSQASGRSFRVPTAV